MQKKKNLGYKLQPKDDLGIQVLTLYSHVDIEWQKDVLKYQYSDCDVLRFLAHYMNVGFIRVQLWKNYEKSQLEWRETEKCCNVEAVLRNAEADKILRL